MGSLSASQFVDLLVGGLAVGCVYSLVALGFAMIMRATSIIHFAQGEVMMLGCMCGLTAMWLLPVLPVVLVVAVGMISSGVIAVTMELAVYRTLRRRRVPIMNVITATVGMSILCINAARIIWGSEPLRFPELFATTAYELGGVRICRRCSGSWSWASSSWVRCSFSSSTRAPASSCRRWLRIWKPRSSWERT